MGAIVALGTSALWPLAFGGILSYLAIRQQRIKLDRSVIALAILIAATSLWSPNPGKGLLWAANLLAISIAVRQFGIGQHYSIPIAAIMAAHLITGVFQYLGTGARFHGLADNASALGLAGLAVYPLPFGAVLLGASLSRTALLGVTVLTLLRPTRLMVVSLLLAVIVSLVLGHYLTPERYSLQGIENASEARVAAITGTSVETCATCTVEPTARKLQWFGYGYGGYYLSTGQIQPHNVFVLSVWELGILSIPFWSIVLALWWRTGRNWYVLTVAVVVGMFTDEYYGSMEGLYMLLAMGVTFRSVSNPIDFWRNESTLALWWKRRHTDRLKG